MDRWLFIPIYGIAGKPRSKNRRFCWGRVMNLIHSNKTAIAHANESNYEKKLEFRVHLIRRQDFENLCSTGNIEGTHARGRRRKIFWQCTQTHKSNICHQGNC